MNWGNGYFRGGIEGIEAHGIEGIEAHGIEGIEAHERTHGYGRIGPLQIRWIEVSGISSVAQVGTDRIDR